jgi:hypothetical protein
LPAEPVVTDDLLLTDDPEELAVPALLVPGAGGTATLAELPAPLGSLPELFRPPALAGPDGTPLTAVDPAPADPAFGEPTALPLPADGPLAAPSVLAPVPWANEIAEPARIAIATIEAVADILRIWKSPFWDLTTARVAGSAPERFPPTAIEPTPRKQGSTCAN